jgi:hypothetical protein
MIWLFYFLIFLPLTLIYTGVILLGLLYFSMGLRQFGNRRLTHTTMSGSLKSMMMGVLLLALASYAYFNYVWLW